jgi:hypothetical protein
MPSLSISMLVGCLLFGSIPLANNSSVANPNFIYAILRQQKRIEALRNFTLEQGQEEVDRENRLRKDRGESSPKVSFSMSEMQRPKQEPETPTTPASPGAFEIGDDSDEEGEEAGKPAKKNELTPTSPVTSPLQEDADAVPLQLRGMSEKARGKLPENAFQRQGSTTSLANHVSGVATPTTGGAGFVPTHAWVSPPRRYLTAA